MRVWIIYGYDIDWKEAYVHTVHASREDALIEMERMKGCDSYRWRSIELAERDLMEARE